MGMSCDEAFASKPTRTPKTHSSCWGTPTTAFRRTCELYLWQSHKAEARTNKSEIHFLAEMSHNEPYACKQTTAFVGLANSFCGSATKQVRSAILRHKKRTPCGVPFRGGACGF